MKGKEIDQRTPGPICLIGRPGGAGKEEGGGDWSSLEPCHDLLACFAPALLFTQLGLLLPRVPACTEPLWPAFGVVSNL